MKCLNAALAVLLLVGAAHAGLTQKEKGVWVDDFDGEIFLDWESGRGAAAETVQMMGDAMLSIQGRGSAALVGVRPKNFSVSVDVKGSGGIRVGGRFAAMLTDVFGGQIEVTDGRKLLLRRELPKATAVTQRITVVSAGSLLRVQVGEQVVYERIGDAPDRGGIELIADGKGALFDNLRVTVNLSPQEGLAVVPVAEKNALVFRHDQAVRVTAETTNQTPDPVALVAAVSRFKGTPVSTRDAEKPEGRVIVEYGVDTFFHVEPLPDEVLARAETTLAPKTTGKATFEFGDVPAGLHMLAIRAKDNTAGLVQMTPLCVLPELPPQPENRPIVIGCYTKQMNFLRKTSALWANTYVHAIACDLRANGFNAVVASGNFEPAVCDIFGEYGVAVLSRGGAVLDHPNVIGSLIGDEPKPEDIPELQQEYATYEPSGKHIVTCFVGDGLGLGGPRGPIALWRQLKPKTRMFRWYGIKKSHYGVLHHVLYKGTLPFTSVLRIARTSAETPFWVVLPSFGSTAHEGYFMFPRPGDIKGMMHLAAACGARGMLLYTYQGHGKFQGMVDPVTLERHGDVFPAAGTAATKIGRHADLIASLKLGGMDVRCRSARVHPLPVHSDAGRFVYAVNKDARNPVETRLLLWAEKYSVRQATDIFTDEALTVNPEDDEGYISISVSFEPGQGRLVRVDFAQPDK